MSATASYCQLLSATVRYCQLLSATVGYSQLLPATISYYQLLPATVGGQLPSAAVAATCVLSATVLVLCRPDVLAPCLILLTFSIGKACLIWCSTAAATATCLFILIGGNVEDFRRVTLWSFNGSIKGESNRARHTCGALGMLLVMFVSANSSYISGWIHDSTPEACLQLAVASQSLCSTDCCSYWSIKTPRSAVQA